MLSSPLSPSCSIDSTSNATKKPKRTYTKRTKLKKDAMLDTSRVMLCMFTVSIMIFNPFSLIMPTADPFQSDQANQFENKIVSFKIAEL